LKIYLIAGSGLAIEKSNFSALDYLGFPMIRPDTIVIINFQGLTLKVNKLCKPDPRSDPGDYRLLMEVKVI